MGKRGLYPLFLLLEGRAVLVVGGGVVATRKVEELLSAGARITVVAEQAESLLIERAARAELTLHLRSFVDDDIASAHAWLVIAATNDSAVNARIAEAAERARVFVNAVDDPDHASAFFGAVLDRDPFLVAISTRGELPALARLMREVLEAALPTERFIAAARALRAKWRADGTPMTARFPELVRALLDHTRPELPGDSR